MWKGGGFFSGAFGGWENGFNQQTDLIFPIERFWATQKGWDDLPRYFCHPHFTGQPSVGNSGAPKGWFFFKKPRKRCDDSFCWMVFLEIRRLENPPVGCFWNPGKWWDITGYWYLPYQPLSRISAINSTTTSLQLINLVGRERSNERGWPIEVMTQGLHDLLRCHRKMIQIEEMEGYSRCWNWRAIVKSSNFFEKRYRIY